MDWLFKNENHIYSLRVAGVTVHNNCLLVQREKGNYVYAIPGGHVRIGETLADALIREYSEEMNFSIYSTRLLWTEECFGSWSGFSNHTITFYYLIELLGNYDFIENSFHPHNDNQELEYGWVPLEQLEEIEIYPDFIKQEIHVLDHTPKHFITRT